MIDDKEKWDLRHKENPPIKTPLKLLEDFISLANPNKALDIACGMGRNSLFMRDCGFCVESVDISSYALDSLQNQPNITPILADLDCFKIPPNQYDLICNSYFLERRLFPFILKGLKKGGILVFETFALSDDENLNAFAKDSSHLLYKNELLRAFLDLEILFYEEKIIERTRSPLSKALVASLVAKA